MTDSKRREGGKDSKDEREGGSEGERITGEKKTQEKITKWAWRKGLRADN